MATPTLAELAARITALEETLAGVTVIRQGRPPVFAGTCAKGNDPTSCPNASVHQYQQGCHAQACSTANATYYSGQRAGKKASTAAAKLLSKPVKRAPKASTEPTPKPARLRMKTQTVA